jgi:hypothetical protein
MFDKLKRNWMLLLAALLFAIAAIGNLASRAECDPCIATFCGSSSECPGGCYCDFDTWSCRGSR